MEREAAEVTREVATALAFLHENGVAHRDLKPQNVLCLNKDQVRDCVTICFLVDLVMNGGCDYVSPSVITTLF